MSCQVDMGISAKLKSPGYGDLGFELFYTSFKSGNKHKNKKGI